MTRLSLTGAQPNRLLLREMMGGLVLLVGLALIEALVGTGWLQRVFGPLTVPVSRLAVAGAQVVTLPLQPAATWYRSQQQLTAVSQQLAALEGKAAQVEQLQAENAQLRALLENRHLDLEPRRLARPVVSSIAPLVWLGEGSDVQPGWLLLYKDTALGQVVRVDGQYARVGLLGASPDISFLVQTAGGVKGVTKARQGRVAVTNIAPEASVAQGERVTTVGQPGVPPGKFVGIVAQIETDPASATRVLVLDQLVSFYQTSIVEIEE